MWEKNEMVLGRAYQPPQRRPMYHAGYHLETMTRKDDKRDQPSDRETTWTNTGATRYGRGLHAEAFAQPRDTTAAQWWWWWWCSLAFEISASLSFSSFNFHHRVRFFVSLGLITSLTHHLHYQHPMLFCNWLSPWSSQSLYLFLHSWRWVDALAVY